MSEIQDNADKLQDNTVDAALVAKLNSGEANIADLSDAQAEQLMRGQEYASSSEQVPVVADLAPTTPVEIPQEQTKPKEFDVNLEYKKAKDELNHHNQLAQNAERKRNEHERKLREDPYYREQYFKDLGINVDNTPAETISSDADVYDEQTIKSLIENQNKLAQEVDYYKQAQQHQLETEKANVEYENSIRSIRELQNEFPDLKTTKDFKELNEEYVTFSGKIGLDNVDRVMTDPNYRQQIEAQGISVPADLNKISQILTLNQTMNTGKNGIPYPNLRSAYLDNTDFRKSFEQTQATQENTVYQNGLDMVADKMNQNQSQQPTAPSTGSGDFIDNNVMDQEYMLNWMKSNPNPGTYNSAQRETWDRIQSTIQSQAGG